MLTRRFSTAFILIALAGGTLGIHASASNLNPAITRIAGVSIGMTSTQAIAALRAIAIRPVVSKQPCVHDFVVQKAKRLGGAQNNCVGRLFWRRDGEELFLTLIEDFPSRPGASVVSQIGINSFNNAFFPDGSQLAGAVLKNLGAPTRTQGKLIALWCAEACDGIQRTIENPASGATLYLRRGLGGGLELSDERYSIKRVRAAAKYLTARGIKPY